MATTWKIDLTYNEVEFKVKYLMISTVTGSFKTFDLILQLWKTISIKSLILYLTLKKMLSTLKMSNAMRI